MTTRDQAVASAGECIAAATRTALGLDGTSVEEAARLAWTPTGPPLDVLIDRIRERRKQVAAA